MASVTLHPEPSKWPIGSTINVFAKPKTPWSESGRPPGAEITSAVVVTAEGNAAVTFSGLTAGASYIGWASGATYLAFTLDEAAAGSGTVTSVNGKEGAVTLAAEDVGAVGTVSPAFTANPTAPTAAEGTNNTQLATTKYADRAVSVEAALRTSGDAEAVKVTGTQTVAGVKTFSSSPVVPTPTTALQAVTKGYVDSAIEGLNAHPNARVATAAALPANIYLSGVITGSSVGALTVDGIAVATGNRVLVKNEATKANNGLYVVTAPGAVAEAFVLTRAADMNEAAEIPGAFAFAEEGTVNAKNGYFVASPGPFTIGTTAIEWSQFTGSGDLVAGSGITLTGNEISAAKAREEAEAASGLHMAVHASVTTNGTTGTVNNLHPVNDEAESRTIKLPTGQVAGSRIAFEKFSNAAHEVEIEGNIRGEAAQTLKLRLYRQTVLFVADSSGSWWPVALYCPLSVLTTTYVQRTITVPSSQVAGNTLLAEWEIHLFGTEKMTLVRARIRTTSGTVKVAITRGEAGTTEIPAYKALAGAETQEVVESEQALSDKDRIRVTSSGESADKGAFIDVWFKVEK